MNKMSTARTYHCTIQLSWVTCDQKSNEQKKSVHNPHPSRSTSTRSSTSTAAKVVARNHSSTTLRIWSKLARYRPIHKHETEAYLCQGDSQLDHRNT
jgi:hypothetical protein